MTDVTWYVVASKPKREGHAAADLWKLGYTVLFLRHWVTTSSRKHTQTELQPMVPGYIFVAVDDAERQSVRAINDNDEVIGVVAFGASLATIREADMWHIRRYFDPEGILPPEARSLRHLRKVIRSKLLPKMPKVDAHEILARLDALDDSGRYRIRTDSSTGDVGASGAAARTAPDSSAWSAAGA